jgi:hypothetical protein
VSRQKLSGAGRASGAACQHLSHSCHAARTWAPSIPRCSLLAAGRHDDIVGARIPLRRHDSDDTLVLPNLHTASRTTGSEAWRLKQCHCNRRTTSGGYTTHARGWP